MSFKGILILIGLILMSSVAATAQVKKAQDMQKKNINQKRMVKKTPLSELEIKEFQEDVLKARKENVLIRNPIRLSPPAYLETTIDNAGTVTVTVKGGEIGREEKQKEAAELQKTLQRRQDFLNRWAKENCTEGQNTMNQLGASGSWYYSFVGMEEYGQQRPSDNTYRYPTRSELEQLCKEYYSHYRNGGGVWYGVTEEFAKTATLDKTNGCVFFPLCGITMGTQHTNQGSAFYWSSDQFKGYWGSSDSQAAYDLVHISSYGAPEGRGIQLKVRFIRK